MLRFQVQQECLTVALPQHVFDFVNEKGVLTGGLPGILSVSVPLKT